MTELKRYHEIPGALHVGCEAPAAYFIPFENAAKAAGDRKESAFFTGLCGEWSFGFIENIARVDIESPDFPGGFVCADTLNVPGNWQLETDRGYDPPNYINQDYPYPVDPPYLPDEIPAGLYRKSVSLIVREDKRYIINFEGVSSCFYLWVNGVFIGYSQVSHCTSALDITSAVKNGENLFEVLVVKHCDGSYLEDQDFFRLSGIFREVYVLEREKNGIDDVQLVIGVEESLEKASLKAELTLGEGAEVAFALISPEGETLAQGSAENGSFRAELCLPVLWNPEAPVLYRLLLSCGEEFISLPVGFKRFEIKDSTVFLNGVKVKARGINRHDSRADTGYWVSEERMLEELYSLKRANVNTIRTSHYPNDPRFLEMCDRLGFMVVDEADLETHGMGYNFGDWYWDYWAFLTDSPDWKETCLDRAARLYERDKNHVCVIMWSLGNESGCGKNHRAMANFIRSRDPEAIIHYENAHLEYAARLNKDFSDISDVESRMYAPLDYLRNYLADPEQKKPFFYCEYVCSMSTGEIEKHWAEDIEENDKYFGGCVWEYCDHAVNIGTADAPKYRYGGDFGDWPNDNICCVDGLVHPDRRPRPGYYDMKKVYEPFKITFNDGVLTVKSKKFFTSLDDCFIKWKISTDDETVIEGSTGPLCLAPGETGDFRLFDKKEFGGFTLLDVSVCLANDEQWAEKGYETGFAQFVLSDKVPAVKSGEVQPEIIRSDRTDLTVRSGNTVYYFDKITASVTQIEIDGTPVLSEPSSFSLWRPATYNTRHLLDVWGRARYDKIKQKTYSVNVTESDEGVKAECLVSFASAAMPPAVKAKLVWLFGKNGGVTAEIEADVTCNAPALPRFGLKLVMPESFNKTSYLGFGPFESYADRHHAAKLGFYRTTAAEDYEHYVKPQESSSHYGTRLAGVKNENGLGLVFNAGAPETFCFKAIPYSDEMIYLTAHDDELVNDGKTFVSLDYKINASNAGAPEDHDERVFDEKKFLFKIGIMPVNA